MRILLLTALLALAPALPAQEQAEPAPPTTHQEAALMLIDLLTQVEACLASCTDEASVQQALPVLTELSEQAQKFKLMQDSLQEPTVQDYMVAQDLLGAFNTVWNAIRDHIARLEQQRLITPELRRILVIAEEQ